MCPFCLNTARDELLKLCRGQEHQNALESSELCISSHNAARCLDFHHKALALHSKTNPSSCTRIPKANHTASPWACRLPGLSQSPTCLTSTSAANAKESFNTHAWKTTLNKSFKNLNLTPIPYNRKLQ